MTATMALGRPAEHDRFSKYFGYAVVAHIALVALLAFAPADWLRKDDDAERNIMYISLGGAPGPRLTGMNAISARPVQEAVPEPVRPQLQAPAEKPPVMTIPEKVPAKQIEPPTRTRIDTTTERPVSRTPIRGAEVREGQARVDTGAKTAGTGLSLGGGEQGTGGETNLANFCCPAYIEAMISAIYRNWKQNQGVAGSNVARFVIERDGRISSVELVTPSPHYGLNRESLLALTNARMPQLPREFTEPRLIVRLKFEYQR